MTIDEIRNEVQKKVIAEQTDVIMRLNERQPFVSYVTTATTPKDDNKEEGTGEFEEYLSKIKRWAAEFLHIVIPDPNEAA